MKRVILYKWGDTERETKRNRVQERERDDLLKETDDTKSKTNGRMTKTR